MTITAIILAAGQGTRMRSSSPKVLHQLLGRPMLQYSLDAARAVTDCEPIVVVGYGAEKVQDVLGEAARFVIQEPQLGTGHAVQQTEPLLRGKTDLVVVGFADMPLLSAETLRAVIDAQRAHTGPITMTTILAEDPRGFGRIIRDERGQVQAIVEEAQASPEQLLIHELNASVYCFRADWLWGALRRVPLSPKGEYYLTDVVGIAVSDGLSVQALLLQDPEEAIGINTRVHLAEAEALLRNRINQRWMLAGVTLIDPASTYIEPGVTIGQDTIIWPNTYLQGNTTVGADCILGPNTIVRNTHIGDRCKVFSSVLEGAVIDDHVDIGPFAHLRKGAHLASGVHMGNFGEVKNSYLGPGTKMGHFSYIGDANIGSEVNIGAGTITCNYDGEKKNPTEIGAGVFIGSDTMLVAPVKLGIGARTGAGSVVTKDVKDHTLVVGVPARPIRRLEKRD
ncbi:MAG: bifunctional UDP-N-acetylglucosamine diphosphorylase/glucosamine-1-phosphate N-acetyltransferase GlmU [Chloroflexota bacterium]